MSSDCLRSSCTCVEQPLRLSDYATGLVDSGAWFVCGCEELYQLIGWEHTCPG